MTISRGMTMSTAVTAAPPLFVNGVAGVPRKSPLSGSMRGWAENDPCHCPAQVPAAAIQDQSVAIDPGRELERVAGLLQTLEIAVVVLDRRRSRSGFQL